MNIFNDTEFRNTMPAGLGYQGRHRTRDERGDKQPEAAHAASEITDDKPKKNSEPFHPVWIVLALVMSALVSLIAIGSFLAWAMS